MVLRFLKIFFMHHPRGKKAAHIVESDDASRFLFYSTLGVLRSSRLSANVASVNMTINTAHESLQISLPSKNVDNRKNSSSWVRQT